MIINWKKFGKKLIKYFAFCMRKQEQNKIQMRPKAYAIYY